MKHRHSLSLIRTCLLIYILLILYASLYPFAGWKNPGVIPLSFLSLPFPRYWTWFDILINIVGYIPLGFLLFLGLASFKSPWGSACLSLLGGLSLSLCMESIQAYLPSRVPSNLDLATNGAGTAFGIIMGIIYQHSFSHHDRFRRLRQNWFGRPDVSRILIIPVLWPVIQIYPQAYLFGCGQILPVLSRWLSEWTGDPIDLATYLRSDFFLTPTSFLMIEIIITITGVVSAVLILFCVLDKKAPKGWLAVTLIGLALIIKTVSWALLFMPGNAFVWLTPGALIGLLSGSIMLCGLVYAPFHVQRFLAIFLLCIGLVIVNIMPDNQYFLSTLQTWSQGKFLHFNGAAYFLSLIWPLLALWILARPIYRSQQIH